MFDLIAVVETCSTGHRSLPCAYPLSEAGACVGSCFRLSAVHFQCTFKALFDLNPLVSFVGQRKTQNFFSFWMPAQCRRTNSSAPQGLGSTPWLQCFSSVEHSNYVLAKDIYGLKANLFLDIFWIQWSTVFSRNVEQVTLSTST